MSEYALTLGDCREVMAAMQPESVDAVVCDPPYGLSKEPKIAEVLTHWLVGDDFKGTGGGFMGKTWDSFVPGPLTWREAFRVLRPGGHLIAFAGSRTADLMSIALRIAGFEIRDTLMYLYGAGFPKSKNISADTRFCACSALPYTHGIRSQESAPGINVPGVRGTVPSAPFAPSPERGSLLFGDVPEQDVRGEVPEDRRHRPGRLDRGQPGELQGEDVGCGQPGMARRRDAVQDARGVQGRALREGAGVGEADGASGRLRDGAPADRGAEDRPASGAPGGGASPGPRPDEQRVAEPGVVAQQRGAQERGAWPLCDRCGKPRIAGGLGTCLKPAFEPIILARKPITEQNIASNVERHGTGALNIEACRIGTAVVQSGGGQLGRLGIYGRMERDASTIGSAAGRWPANVVLDEEAAQALDAQSGERQAGGFPKEIHGASPIPFRSDESRPERVNLDAGGASRFFYTAKAARSEREYGLEGQPRKFLATMGDGIGGREHNPDQPSAHVRNHHPTVKPVDLMRWLCRLVTPPGGLILDPFMGSGTTGVAATLEGFRFVGIEIDPEYMEIARLRIGNAQPSLFGQEPAA